MRTLFCGTLGLVAMALLGVVNCVDVERPDLGPIPVPVELIPPGPKAPDWQLALFADYVRRHAESLGFTGSPARPICQEEGVPVCEPATSYMYFCVDTCGKSYWSFDDGTCVDAMNGTIYACDGRARH